MPRNFWRIMACAGAFLVGATAGLQASADGLVVGTRLPQFLAGGDISLLTLEEEHGQVYKYHGKPMPALQIFQQAGWNCMRLRLWVHPTGKSIFVNDLKYTESLGRRIKAAGFYLVLDLHYSDTWADPGHQFVPAAWQNLNLHQLARKVFTYTRNVVAAMKSAGAMPDMVAVGNEISPGMMWPLGRITSGPGGFANLAVLLKAGIAGVKAGSTGGQTPLIMIHLDRGGDWRYTRWFFNRCAKYGVDYDVIGESYYPIFQGNLQALKQTLDHAALMFHKPIVVAETGYAYKDDERPAVPGIHYPKTPAGQAKFLTNLMRVVKSTPDNLGRGVIYWAPEWIPMKGIQGSWHAFTLFDDRGEALPGLDVLGRAASPHILQSRP